MNPHKPGSLTWAVYEVAVTQGQRDIATLCSFFNFYEDKTPMRGAGGELVEPISEDTMKMLVRKMPQPVNGLKAPSFFHIPEHYRRAVIAPK